MGARVSSLNREKWDRRTTPRVSWFLRYRACEKFGHKGQPCPRCGGPFPEPFSILSGWNKDKNDGPLPFIADYFFQENTLVKFLKRERLEPL